MPGEARYLCYDDDDDDDDGLQVPGVPTLHRVWAWQTINKSGDSVRQGKV